ncbi:hypothetical protein K461DRAFT_300476 [Myriangium duriaei CBS 260.36]|uniref:BTB domain-containing protein n=1 Tax=Myriangium duriaei CBS 260.36 TaxID=1168546 RepID=A0A9P4MJR0_9PEZI|nr:hypothetical protein K461DRAFT_300476 [Myriangium duriaei CBS 260.36]
MAAIYDLKAEISEDAMMPPEEYTVGETIVMAADGDIFLYGMAQTCCFENLPQPTPQDAAFVKRYLVSSTVLREVSPFFEAAFSERWKCKISKSVLQAIVLSDEWEELEMLLRACHDRADFLQHGHETRLWETDTMVLRLHGICDKYACHDLFKEWLSQTSFAHLSMSNLGQLLSFAIQYDDGALFQRLTKHLAYGSDEPLASALSNAAGIGDILIHVQSERFEAEKSLADLVKGLAGYRHCIGCHFGPHRREVRTLLEKIHYSSSVDEAHTLVHFFVAEAHCRKPGSKLCYRFENKRREFLWRLDSNWVRDFKGLCLSCAKEDKYNKWTCEHEEIVYDSQTEDTQATEVQW